MGIWEIMAVDHLRIYLYLVPMPERTALAPNANFGLSDGTQTDSRNIIPASLSKADMQIKS